MIDYRKEFDDKGYFTCVSILDDSEREEFLSKIVCIDTTVEVVDKKGDIKGYITNKELETSLVKS